MSNPMTAADTTTPAPTREYDPPLDEGIASMVELLADAGVETLESCQCGAVHGHPEPTVRFHGDRSEGFRALAVLLQAGVRVEALRRRWPVVEGEPIQSDSQSSPTFNNQRLNAGLVHSAPSTCARSDGH